MCYTKFILFAGLVGLAGCNNGKNSPKTNNADSTHPAAKFVASMASSNLSDTGTQKLVTVITGYYQLKNALVATNETNTASSSISLAAAAKGLQGYLLQQDATPGPLKPYLDTLIVQTRIINEIKDNTCERQRLAFSTISSAMFGLIKTAEVKNMHIYHQYCPMAFNEKGATWLSDEGEIKNPYYGNKMLECGEVTDTIK